MITLIAATSENNALGKDGNLLWHLPKDFTHFKNLTMGHCIVMGRKTFETFPKLLPDRKHIIVTRQKDYRATDCIVVSSVEEGIEKALGIDANPFVIGGGEIYHQAMKYAQKIELTRVHAYFEEADAFFPEISQKEWQLVESLTHLKDDKHAYDFTFETYLSKQK
ncbi:dihydrofolate reductase [Capnocytophaga canimorsus]|uniref:dihydrofolate reductase n=1 Tax=Capnocytophaga canimorsus TaxID=28188 RepID=UPI001AC18D40|nr:dihydrofolate reductase [Capnocytophaga canimorsus]GIM59578.1 dihydrofolate reductase [Capnocytophaga canimorsus]